MQQQELGREQRERSTSAPGSLVPRRFAWDAHAVVLTECVCTPCYRIWHLAQICRAAPPLRGCRPTEGTGQDSVLRRQHGSEMLSSSALLSVPALLLLFSISADCNEHPPAAQVLVRSCSSTDPGVWLSRCLENMGFVTNGRQELCTVTSTL